MPQNKHCGYVALLGRSNVGKSTLFNRLLSMQLSSVTPKRQTTRYNIEAVLNEHDYQIVFVDTPGLHFKQQGILNESLNNNARLALSHVDLILFVTEAQRWLSDDEQVLATIARSNKPCLLLINKCDLIKDKTQLLQDIADFAQRHAFAEIFPISALRDKTFERLKQTMARLLPQCLTSFFLAITSAITANSFLSLSLCASKRVCACTASCLMPSMCMLNQ